MQRMRRAICSPRGQLTISLSGPAACMCRHSNSACAGSGLDHSSNKEDEMTSNVVEKRLPSSNTSRLSNEAERPPAAVNQLSRAKQLAQSLLSERGEASGAIVARELHEVFRILVAEDRSNFQRFLATDFAPDATVVRAAAETYLSDPSAEAAALLAQATDPPRQELLRRMNMAPGGTSALVAMRKEIAGRLRDEPTLRLLDSDLKHLFASWFNRGFLELRRIDWQSPAAVLEKLIAYEAVHEIHGWDDLRRRLAPDRRCFGFFHPALPNDPLIFVEVALVEGLAGAVQPLLVQDSDDDAARNRAAPADTAIFYSISNCQDGLRGISFGNFLIKQVVEELKNELQHLTRFSTLSPVPGFRRWLTKRLASTGDAAAALLARIETRAGRLDTPEGDDSLKPLIMRFCAAYLTRHPPRASSTSRPDPPPFGKPRRPRGGEPNKAPKNPRAAGQPGIVRHHGELP